MFLFCFVLSSDHFIGRCFKQANVTHFFFLYFFFYFSNFLPVASRVVVYSVDELINAVGYNDVAFTRYLLKVCQKNLMDTLAFKVKYGECEMKQSPSHPSKPSSGSDHRFLSVFALNCNLAVFSLVFPPKLVNQM